MTKLQRVIALLLALVLAVGLTACGAAAEPEKVESEEPAATAPDESGSERTEQALEETASWLLETVPEAGFGSVGGEWLVLGLARSGLEVPAGYYETYFETVAAYTAELGGVLHERKYTEYSRVILAMTAIGRDPTDVGGYNLLTPLADYEQTVFQGINGPIFALLALDSGNYEIPENAAESIQATRELYVDAILGGELPSGGWSFSGGGDAEADLTAMALQALAKYRDRPDVDEAVEHGLTALSEMQSGTGDFLFGGEASCESVAQVIVALTELGIPAGDARFVKAGNTLEDCLLRFRNGDGSFRHIPDGEADMMATEQAFYALAALSRQEQGKATLYTMTD